MAVVSGGTTLIDNGALDSAVPSGKLTLLSTQTASASATIDFTSGIDSTYDSYVFKFINIHPATDNVNFTVNFSTDGGSNYNVTKTSTYFQAYHNETNGVSALNYVSDRDLAQSTSDQQIANGIGSDNDQQASGYLHLYNPSNTTFVKHFITRFNIANEAQYSVDNYVAGYGNTTSSIDAVQFKMDSGNIDDGIIKMYGVG
jgi:hypothetical protein